MSGVVIEHPRPLEVNSTAVVVRHPGGTYSSDDPDGPCAPMIDPLGTGVVEVPQPITLTDGDGVARVAGSVRAAKDYVIRLDPNGRAIVSPTVLRRLQEAHKLAPDHFPEWRVISEVEQPPRQYAGPGGDNGLTLLDVRKMVDGQERTISAAGQGLAFDRRNREMRAMTDAEERQTGVRS